MAQLRKITKVIFLSAFGVVAVGFIAAYVADERASAAFAIGNTYPVAKLGHVCVTVEGLSRADYHGAATLAQAERDGCVMIDKGMFSVTVLEKDAALVKVRVNAGGLDANNFEGWTEAENIAPAS